MYGPTETVCGITMENPVVSSDLDKTPLGFSVGRESSIYIMLPNMRLAPIGCIGEILISGPTVGMGYFGDEEMTKACFIEDPFRPQFRMYKTGDYGWYGTPYIWLLSAHIRTGSTTKEDFSSTAVAIIKSATEESGSKVVRLLFPRLSPTQLYLDHLESVLSETDSPWKVAACVLHLRDAEIGTVFFAKELVIGTGLADLNVSLTSETKVQARHLLELGKSMLTPYFVPEIWVPMKALPCTTTGKLNRRMMKNFFYSLEPDVQNAVFTILE
jgi:acyl-CoA synthetase (AMP-forming)/AMP-acid ligase II